MNNINLNTLNNRHNHICWSAIFGGVVVAIITGLALNLLSAGLGFSRFMLDTETTQSLSLIVIIWAFTTGIVSMFIGGWVASALTNITDSTKGYWQGFIVAGVSILVMVYIATNTASSILGGTFNALGSLSTSLTNSTANATSTINNQDSEKKESFSKENIMQKAKEKLPESMTPVIDQINYEADVLSQSITNKLEEKFPGIEEGGAKENNVKNKAEFYRKNVRPALHHFLQSINTDNYDQARKDLVEALSQASGKSTEEIDAKIATWQKSYETAKEKAKQEIKENAKKVASIVSSFSLVNFLLVLVSTIAAGIGGMVGANRNK